MQEMQKTRQAQPPVGWLAYCRFVQAARIAELEQARGGQRKDDHATAN